MKLITHNLMTSKCLKGVKVGYPLRIVAKDIKIIDADFNAEFTRRLLPKLDWTVLINAAEQIGHRNGLPEELTDDYEDNEEFLKKIHHVLMEVEVVNGELICPETGHKFPISAGIPDFILKPHEVALYK